MSVIQLPNGMSVRTYDPAPAGFDPLTAPDHLLLHHGFPARPDPQTAPQLHKLWERAVSGTLTYVVPTFREAIGKTHGPGRQSVTAGSDTSPNLSGSVVFVPDAGHSFQWILGQWTVPNPYPATADTWDFATQWIGIDVWGESPDLLLVGTQTSFYSGGGVLGEPPSYGPQSGAFWQWGPKVGPGSNREIGIDNFPVAPGDVIWGALCVNSLTSVSVYLSNVSRGSGTSFTITPPSGSGLSLMGDSAGWIVGRPVLGDVLPGLARYGAIYFDMGRANVVTGTPGSKQNPTEIDLGSGTLITMVGSNNDTLSVPTIETQQLMKVVWVNAV